MLKYRKLFVIKIIFLVSNYAIPVNLKILLVKLTKSRKLFRLFDPNVRRKIGVQSYKPKYLNKKGLNDVTLKVDVNEHLGWMWATTGSTDMFPYTFVKSFKNKETLFIDIGSNIGSISLPIAKAGYDVIAFEPQSKLVEESMYNARTNGIQKYLVFNLALGRQKVKKKHTYINLNFGNLGSSSLLSNWNPGTAPIKKEKVLISSLDEVLKLIPIKNWRNFVIKIDVEGYESNVIQGANNFIKKFKPFILMEHRPDLNKKNNKRNKIFKKLDNYTYFGMKLQKNGRINFLDFNSNLKYENVLAVPKSKLTQLLKSLKENKLI